MATQRYISTSFWDDEWIQSLDPSEKLLYLYLMTNPLTNIAGVYKITERRISFDTGFSHDTIHHILAKFEKAGKVNRYKEYIVLPSWPKHQKWEKSNKTKIGIDSVLASLETDVILFLVKIGYKYQIDEKLVKSACSMDAPCMPHGSPSNYLDSDFDSDFDSDTIRSSHSELSRSSSIEVSDQYTESVEGISKGLHEDSPKEIPPFSPLSLPLENPSLTSPYNPPSKKILPSVCAGEPCNGSEMPKTEQKPYITDQAAQNLIAKFTESEEYANELMVFVKHRRQIKKPMTPLALEQTLKMLGKKLGTDQERIDCLELSIANGWQGVFPDKTNKQGYGRQKAIGRASTESGSLQTSPDDYGI